ncbi:MAG: hypothetical protein JNK72_03450 [Myxococcales bacterium]|nr:hypothetical protein [Myxococcales bacterium]
MVAATSFAGAQDLNNNAASHGGDSITSTAGPTDHSVVVNRLGLRYFGASSLPSLAVMGGNPSAGAPQTIHTVGLRYWLNGGMGIEAGLGFGFRSASSTTTTQTGSTTNTSTEDDPNFFGLGLHFGLPVVLAEAKHVNIQLVPYAALAFGTSSITTGEGDNVRDVSSSAVQLRAGANLAAELQFGFIGVPQLGLQAQFGAALALNYFSALAELRRNGDTVEVSSTNFTLGTTLGPHYGLADIISGSISAVWYFGGAPGR